MTKPKFVVYSKHTISLVQKLNREYKSIQKKMNEKANDKTWISIDKRVQLEMDLVKSVREDLKSLTTV